MRSSYACAVGQWLQVNTMANILDVAKLLSVYVFPSMPDKLKAGALLPIGSVTGSVAKAFNANNK